MGLTSGSGRCPGEGSGHPHQCSCLGKPMDRRRLVGHSPWGCGRVRHNIVTKHKPPTDYSTDCISLLPAVLQVFHSGCWWIQCLPEASKWLCSVGRASSLLFPEHPLALSVRDFFVCGNWPGKFSELGLVLMFPVESFIPKLSIYSEITEFSTPFLCLLLGMGLFSAQSLNTSTEVGCSVVWPEPGWARMPCPGFSTHGRSLCGQTVLAVSQLWTHMQNPKEPDSNRRLQWNIPVLGDVFIKKKSNFFYLDWCFFFCYCIIYNLVEK